MGPWTMALLDLLAIIFGLLVFALFHHVLPTWFPRQRIPEPVAISTPAPQEIVPVPAAEAETPETTPKPQRSGMWGERYAEQFTDGEVIQTENSYRSGNVSVTVETVSMDGLVYHVAEIYVSDLKYLRAALGQDEWGHSEMPLDQARRHRAVVAISGDHYYARWEGFVIRNGMIYRDNPSEDLCVLLQDGRMFTYSAGELDWDTLLEMEPWQVWSFGPSLLDNGEARENILSTLNSANPRSAIGYVEPGHYFFVQVDGRGGFGSRGMTMQELASLFESLGCETAYNLDGGRSAAMVWGNTLISYPYYRPVSDIIYITDREEDEP